ncbi:hypothetical protein AADR41_22055 [Streptomyces sp. CLV115]|uniref:hypothetical protein n=1 Tax=Streptomyces sp. CLV115 TaxID=3138502 RepID=UPI00313B7019
MVVPGLYGCVSACKRIKDIELTTLGSCAPHWAERGWARRAPIKTESRIDTLKAGASCPFPNLRNTPRTQQSAARFNRRTTA